MVRLHFEYVMPDCPGYVKRVGWACCIEYVGRLQFYCSSLSKSSGKSCTSHRARAASGISLARKLIQIASSSIHRSILKWHSSVLQSSHRTSKPFKRAVKRPNGELHIQNLKQSSVRLFVRAALWRQLGVTEFTWRFAVMRFCDQVL